MKRVADATQNQAPSPPAQGFLGHFRPLTSDPIHYLVKSAREYGDIVHFNVRKINIYLISHPDDIERFLVTDNKNFRKPRILRHTRETLGQGLITSEGSFWLRQRRLAAPAFHRKQIDEYGRVMAEKTQQMLERWNGITHRDVHQDMMALTLDIVTSTLFGTDIGAERERRVAAIMEILLGRFIDYQSLYFMFMDWFPRPKKIKFRKAKKEVDAIIFDIIEERRASGLSPEEDPTLLGTYLAARDDEGKGMSNEQLLDECITLFLAGHETTGSLLTFVFYLLSLNPEKRERLEEELEDVLDGRPPTVEDIPKLRYTKQIIKETLRLYPPVWRIGRESLHDWSAHGYHIPAGSQFMASQWVVHRDPRWYDRPEEFIPERWTEEFERGLPRYAWFPYGGGPRLCIGASFAEMEATIVLASIAQRFRLHYTTSSPGELELYPSITLRPVHGLPVSVEAYKKERHFSNETRL